MRILRRCQDLEAVPFPIFLKTLQPWHALLVAAGHLFSRWIQLAERDSRGQSRFHRLHRQLPRLRDYRYPLRKGLALFCGHQGEFNASHRRLILMRVCASDRLLDHLLERERGRARESERARERETERKGEREKERGTESTATMTAKTGIERTQYVPFKTR